MAQAVENFAELLEESTTKVFQGAVITGTVVSVTSDSVLIDVGLKSEGRIALREFSTPGQEIELKSGDKVEVFVERYEDRNGEILLSRDKARREESWKALEVKFNATERVTGEIFNRVKGGFTVDLGGVTAFLPGSQIDVRPVKDVEPLMNTAQPFQILKMDKARGNIVVSRRSILEEERASERAELVAKLSEGQVLEGDVKNITDYGAFIDLGGVDGLLHVTDISWSRVNHPTEVLSVGQTLKVKIIKFNPENQRISLGLKQLEPDPWESIGARYPVGSKVAGKVSNVTDYGAFVEIEQGIEGLVHVSEMSWTKKNVHPNKIVASKQEVQVQILEVDSEKRRISLGLKQTQANPWDTLQEKFSIGSEIEGEVRNITEFGLFVAMTDDIDGMIHLSDLDWNVSGDEAVKEYSKGQVIKAKVLDIDADKERISLGIKQLSEDTIGDSLTKLKKGDVITTTVSEVSDAGLTVEIEDGIFGVIRKVELARERGDQRPERFAVGEKVDAKVTSLDRKNRRIYLSIKAREFEEEKQAMEEYGASDSGATLGDIFGALKSDDK